MSDVSKIRIRSDDGGLFEVPKNVASLSGHFRNILNDNSQTDVSEVSIQMSSAIFGRILAFLYKHCFEPCPEVNTPVLFNDLSKILPKWYAGYFKVDHEMLLDLIIGSSRLDIPPLRKLASLALSCQLYGKSYEELVSTYNLTKPKPSAAEMKLLKENNLWAFEHRNFLPSSEPHFPVNAT